MNGKIKGLIVEIGGDASGLELALKNAEKNMRGTVAEMTELNKLLKVDPTNWTLLAQKQSIVGIQITENKNKLKALQQAQEEYNSKNLDKTTANYRALEREIEKTQQKIKELERLNNSSWYQLGEKLQQVGDKFKDFGKKTTELGKKLTTSLTVPIVAVGTVVTKSAIDFETAFTGVEKTVDGTTEQLEKLKAGIREMAKEIPATTTEISKVSELAGQLGIATDDILNFTEVMIRLGTSTNLSAEEASSALAKFANVTKMSAKDYERLGSVIVDLGNNYATTEADIVNMGTRLGSASAQVGISQAKTMGLATALSSVGIESEAGATAMSKLLKRLQVAVEVGGDDLQDFAKISGMTANEFKKAYEKDATNALIAFIKGLNNTKRNGKSAVKVLQDMEIKEVRLSNAILGLANNTDLLENALKDSEKAWKENNALNKESEKRYQTLQSKIEILKNKLLDIAITVGNKLMPHIEKTVEKIGEWAEGFNDLDDSTIDLLIQLGSIVAVIGPILVGIGKVITAVGTIIHSIGTLQKAVGTIINFTGPLGIVLSGIALIGVGFASQVAEMNKFKDNLNNIGKGFGEFSNSVDNAKSRLSELDKTFGKAFDTTKIQQESEKIQNKITAIYDTASKERRKLTQKEIDTIEEYFRKLDELSSRQLEVERAKAQAIYESQKSELESYSGNLENYKTLGAELIATQQEQSNKEIEIAKTNAIEKITLKQQELSNMKLSEDERVKQLADYTAKVNAERDKEIANSRLKVGELQSVYNIGYAKLSSQDGEFLNKTKDFLSQRHQTQNYYNEQIRKLKNNEVWYTTNAVGDIQRANENLNRVTKTQTQEYLKNLDKKGQEELGYWLESLTITEMYGGKISDEDKQIATEVLKAFDELPADVKSEFQQTMQGAINGLASKESTLFNKAKEIAGGITNTIAKVLDIHSPSKVTYKQGADTGQGLVNGLKSKKKLVGKTASEIAQIIVDSAEKRLQRIKITQDVGLKYEEGYWKKILSKVKKGTDAYYDALQKYTEAYKAVNEKKQELLDQSKELTEKFTEDVLKIEEDFTKQSQDLWDVYYDKVDARAKQIADAFSIFDEVKLDEAISGTQIISNLENQIDTITDYDSTLQTLQARFKELTGDSGDNLFDYLASQGVKSLDQLKAITSMSDEELKKLVDLYNRKEDIALKQAQREYQTLYEETINAVEQLRKTADEQVEALRQQYIKDLKEVAKAGKKEGINVGTQITKGIRQGLNSGMDQVETELRARVKALTDSVKDELDIHSPSGVYDKEVGQQMALGLGRGFTNKIKSLTSQMSNAVINQVGTISSAIPTSSNQTTNNNNIIIQFYPQEMTEEELNKAFNYVNRRLGTAY